MYSAPSELKMFGGYLPLAQPGVIHIWLFQSQLVGVEIF
jgi:hypothetical protein